jgi:hypothetical protein
MNGLGTKLKESSKDNVFQEIDSNTAYKTFLESVLEHLWKGGRSSRIVQKRSS